MDKDSIFFIITFYVSHLLLFYAPVPCWQFAQFEFERHIGVLTEVSTKYNYYFLSCVLNFLKNVYINCVCPYNHIESQAFKCLQFLLTFPIFHENKGRKLSDILIGASIFSNTLPLMILLCFQIYFIILMLLEFCNMLSGHFFYRKRMDIFSIDLIYVIHCYNCYE